MPGYWSERERQPSLTGIAGDISNSFANAFMMAQRAKQEKEKQKLAEEYQKFQMEQGKAQMRQEEAQMAQKGYKAEEEKANEIQRQDLRDYTAQGGQWAKSQLESRFPEDPMLKNMREQEETTWERDFKSNKFEYEKSKKPPLPTSQISAHVSGMTPYEQGTPEYQAKYKELYEQEQKRKEQEQKIARDIALASASEKRKDIDARAVMDLRKEFQNIEAVKNMSVVATQIGKLQNTSNTGPGDVSLIFAYMKMLDPTSTIRESEYAKAENTANIPESIRQMFNKAKDATGPILLDSQRDTFRKEGMGLYRAHLNEYEKYAKEYSRLSSELGIDPRNTVLDLGYREGRGSTTSSTVPQNILNAIKSSPNPQIAIKALIARGMLTEEQAAELLK